MNTIKPDTYTQTKKVICDWSDKKHYLIRYRLLKFYITLGMVVNKVHIVISFRKSMWLEKYKNFNTQKRMQAEKDFEKDFYKLLNNAFDEKTCEIVRNRKKVDFIKKEDTDKKIKQQSKITFNGFHKSFEIYYSYTFKQNEQIMDKPIYLGFAILKLKKLLMCETYYDKMQPYFGPKKSQMLYLDTDSFVLTVITKDIIKDLTNLEDLFGFRNLDKDHEIFSNKNKTVNGKFRIETPKNISVDEFIALRSKMYAFRCGDDSKNRLKGISKSYSEKIKFEECYKCLFGGEYQQECDNFIIRSINHEKKLQRVKNSTLFHFDDKRCFIHETESIPWK